MYIIGPTVTIPMSRTTTPWKFPSTSTTVSGTAAAAAAAASSRPTPPLLRPLPRGPSTDIDSRRAGGSPCPRSTSSSADALVAPKTIIMDESRRR